MDVEAQLGAFGGLCDEIVGVTPRNGKNCTLRVVASIVLWNTVYLEHAVKALREQGQAVSDDLLPHLSPLGWEHINLTGDYVWRPGEREKHRPLRQLRLPLSQEAPQP